MLIAAFRRWVLGLALLGPGLARPCLAQPDAGPTAGASPAPGQPSAAPLELTWVSSDPTCDGTAVTARALELVTPGVTPRPTQARAELSRDGRSWIVDLQTRSESHAGRRVLRGESCKEIQQAIALLLAMILESEAKSAAAQALAPPAAPPVPPPAAAPNTMLAPNAAAAAIADEEPPPPPAPGPRFGWLLRSDATAALGLKPGLGLSAGVGAALSLAAFELAGGVAYWPTSRTQIFNGAGTLDLSRRTLTIAGCYRFSLGTMLQIVPCVGPEFSWYSYVSAGIDETEEGTKLLVNGTATIDFRFEIVGPMFAALTPGVIWGKSQPFEGKECRDCNRTDVFHTWGIGPRLGAGVGARF